MILRLYSQGTSQIHCRTHVVWLLIQWFVLGFKLLTMEHVVLWLLKLRWLKTCDCKQFTCDSSLSKHIHIYRNEPTTILTIHASNPNSFSDLLSTPFRCSPGCSLALFHYFCHGTHNRFSGSQGIRSMAEHQVHIIYLQTR